MGLRTFLGLKRKPAPEPEPASAIAARRDANQIASLYKDRPYLDAYAEHTNLRVAENPHKAIGGMWEEVGKLQFDYLVGKGLKPHHRLLDIGCGTLRGGRLFIRYLDVGGYTGLELSPAALDYARGLVQTENLSDRRPRLVLNKEKDLRFAPFSGETFDFLLA
ncbi:MAG: class I SAM-dependent methyltransferase [Bradyrhizobiaceae bacterium]|nr:class I SAM-dependent methyltransferase [Bradyrhizobiaceae bacterium]